MCTWPVVIMVSTATRLFGSSASMASRIESLIWSQILSGWPSVTDSEVKRRSAEVTNGLSDRERGTGGSRHHVEDTGGDRLLVALSLGHVTSGCVQHDHRVVVAGEGFGPADPVDDEEVDALALPLGNGQSEK